MFCLVVQQQSEKASSNTLLFIISWQDRGDILAFNFKFLFLSRQAAFLYASPRNLESHLHLRALDSQAETYFSWHLFSIHSVIPFLFPLCRLSIKRINLCAEMDPGRISPCLFSVSVLAHADRPACVSVSRLRLTWPKRFKSLFNNSICSTIFP